MRKKLAALLVALAVVLGLGLASPAAAAVTDGATLGTYTTVQTCGSHTLTYNYDVTMLGSNQKQINLQWAEHSGPAGTRWAPMVNSQMNGGLDKSLSGRGYYQNLGSVPAGTTRITKGTPQAVNWSRVILNYASTDTQGRLLQTTISGASACTSSIFDFTTNVAPPPPTDISGTGLSMDFSCTSTVNTAFSTHWTWYYDVSGTSPSWALTTTGLVRNSETGTPTVDLSFASNPHVVYPDVINFTWTDGDPIPTASLLADWGGGGIFCEDVDDLNANF